jgi:hypothetical protein
LRSVTCPSSITPPILVAALWNNRHTLV